MQEIIKNRRPENMLANCRSAELCGVKQQTKKESKNAHKEARKYGTNKEETKQIRKQTSKLWGACNYASHKPSKFQESMQILKQGRKPANCKDAWN